MDLGGLCKYSNALGEPNVGFHTHYAGFALGDIIGTIMISAAISYTTKKSFMIVLMILVLMAIILHWIFCVPTTLNKLLGLV